MDLDPNMKDLDLVDLHMYLNVLDLDLAWI